MEKGKEDWLRILTYLNTKGFKPYDEIAEWGKQFYEDEEQFKIVFIQMYDDDLVIHDRTKPLPIQGKDYLHTHLMGISQPGKLRMHSLKHEKDSEQSAEKGAREVSGWAKWGAIGAWVAAGLTLIGIIVTIYLAYYPPKPNYVADDNVFPRFQIDTNAVKTDSDKVEVIGADGKPIDYSKGEPPPPPPRKAIEKHPNKAILDSLEVLSPNQSQLVQITYEKGTRNRAYAVELAELLKKNGYTMVTTIEDLGGKRSEKKVYFLRLEQGYIWVYINVY
jgi:hypothetical protein